MNPFFTRSLTAACAFILAATLAVAETGPMLTWSTTVDTGASTADRTRAISMMTNGDVIAAYQIGAGANANIRVKRLAASNGGTVWTRDIVASAADDVADMVIDPATGDAWVATRIDNGANLLDWLVVKLNGTDGTGANSYTYGTTGNDEPRAICRTSDGNIAVVGMETNAGSGLSRFRIVKLNSSTMAVIWSDTANTDNTDLFDVAADASGNIFACGRNAAPALVAKYTSTGTLSWAQPLSGGGSGNNQWNAITILSGGDPVVAGTLSVTAQGNNLAAARYPAAGGVATWSNNVNGTANLDETAYDITRDASDNLYIAGFTRDNVGGMVAYATKLNSAGTAQWVSTLTGTDVNPAATDSCFNVQLVGTDVIFGGTRANTSADIVFDRYTAANGAFQETTTFNGAASNQDTSLNKNLLATNGTVLAIGGDTENTTPSTDGIVRSYGFGPPPPLVTLSASPLSTAEAAGVSTITATLNVTTSTDTIVTLTATGTSSAGDYTLGSTTITIPAGNLTGSTTVTAITDLFDEADETVILDITAVSGGDGAAESGNQQVTVTILDDDPTPSLSIANVSQAEGNSGSSNMTFTVTLNAPSGLPVSVNYATSDGTATSPSDYTAVSGTLNFAPSDTTKTFTVAILGDVTVEPNELFTVTLSSPVNATLGTSSATGTITDDDGVLPPTPVVSTSGEGVVTGGNAPDPTGADSGLNFSLVTRSGFIAENGNLAFASELTGAGVDATNFKGFFKHDGTSLKRLARTGDNAPETGATAAKFSDLPLIPGINDDGQVTLFAQLAANPASTPATTVDNDTGLWSELGGTGFQILIRENDQIPGLPAGILLGRFGSGCFATAKLLDSPPGTGRGEAAFTVTFKGGSTDSALLRTSIIGADTTAVSVVAQENAAAPGVTGESFSILNGSYTDAVRMDAQGNIVFGAVLKPSGKTSLWYQPVAGGTPVKAMVAGDAAPSTTGATFLALDLPIMGDSGTFSFRGVLNAVGDNAANDKNDGIWRGTAAGPFINILRRGDSNTNRPGLFANGTIKAGNIYSGWINNSNHGAWLGWVDSAGDGISSYPADTFGIYTDMGEAMKLLISSGDTAPGMPVGATMFYVDHPVVSGKAPNEYLAFLATVTGGGTTAANNKGIWRSLNGAAPTLVLRTGDSMTVTPGGSKVIADVDIPGSNDAGHVWETPVMDGTGRLLVNVSFTDGTTTQVIIP